MFQYKPYIKIIVCNCAIGNLGFKMRGSRVEKYFLNDLGYNSNSSFNNRDGVEKWVQFKGNSVM
jgi:hypothetical protein